MKNIVLLFPGQGSQHVGMGKETAQEFPEFKKTMEEASAALEFNMQKLCFEDPNAKLNLTEFTQPAILATSVATLKVLEKECNLFSNKNICVQLVAGHSLGEYSALVSLGALKFADALKAVNFRGQAMQRAVPVGVGAMAAYLGTNGDEVSAICKIISNKNMVVEIVNYNSPGQFVLSGHKTAVEKACEEISEKKLGRAKLLPVSAPFHSSLMQAAAHEMRNFFETIQLHPFTGKIVANVDAQIHTSQTYTKNTIIQQIDHAVLWTQSLHNIHNIHCDETIWIEVGPGKVLQGLAKKTIEIVPCVVTNDTAALKDVILKLTK